MTGLNKKIMLATTIGVFICGCLPANKISDEVSQVRLDVATSDEEIKVSVRNAGTANVLLYKPTELSLLPDDPGLEFAIYGEAGKRQELCSFVEPSGDGAPLSLQAGKSVTREFAISYLAKLFCLAPGKYEIRAILHMHGKANRFTHIESQTVSLVLAGHRK